MRWKPQELLYELAQDRQRRILFVEGIRDLAFWRDTVPLPRNANTVIYPISVVECEPGEGGERGRLIRAARQFENTEEASRIHLFADADCDPFLGIDAPSNVTFTDGRDLESYALTPDCLSQICRNAFPSTGRTGTELLDLLRVIARPIGILRIVSAKRALKLPFNKTLRKPHALRKFIKDCSTGKILDIDHLVTVLIQNSDHKLSIKSDVVEMLSAEMQQLAGVADAKIIHGKDLTEVIAWQFDVTAVEIGRLLFMALALERQHVLNCTNVRLVQEWIK